MNYIEDTNGDVARKPADYSHLYSFGCPVYVMYNAKEKIKLDSKSGRYIFLRYANKMKRYHLWDLTAHKILISKDVSPQDSY